MAETVVVQPNSQDSSGGAAWIALAIIVVALVVGGVYMYRHGRAPAATGGTNINVTLPGTGGNTTSGQ